MVKINKEGKLPQQKKFDGEVYQYRANIPQKDKAIHYAKVLRQTEHLKVRISKAPRCLKQGWEIWTRSKKKY